LKFNPGNPPLVQISVKYAELYTFETSFAVDIDGDSKIGLQFNGIAVTLGQVAFGTTKLGYGFRANSNSSIVLISQDTKFVSAYNPGAGWNAVGVARLPNSANFVLY
jgi:hypothetical protein